MTCGPGSRAESQEQETWPAAEDLYQGKGGLIERQTRNRNTKAMPQTL